MTKHLPAIYELLVDSYLATARQQEIGERRQVGPVPCIHYDFVWQGKHVIADNFFVFNGDLPAAIAAIRAYRPAAENQIFVPLDNPAVPKTLAGYGLEYKSADYLMDRLISTEDSLITPVFPVQQAKSREDAAVFTQIEEDNIVLEVDIINPALRYYYILQDGRPVAQARNRHTRPDVSWISHVYTVPSYRKRGLGTALIQQILLDNALAGVDHSVLLSTPAGHRLYHKVGYTDRMTIGCYVWREND
jgi:GNAT superfamily N-acetyltransferase